MRRTKNVERRADPTGVDAQVITAADRLTTGRCCYFETSHALASHYGRAGKRAGAVNAVHTRIIILLNGAGDLGRSDHGKIRAGSVCRGRQRGVHRARILYSLSQCVQLV